MAAKESEQQMGLSDAAVALLSQIPDFLLHPRRTTTPWLENPNPLPRALKTAGALLVVSAAALAALKLDEPVELSSVVFVATGTVTVWILYGMFLHVFAFLTGARKGVKYTVAAYLYVIAFLQPLFTAALWGIVWLVPGGVSQRDITLGLGGSGSARAIVSGQFLSLESAVIFRLVSGLLILFYFAAVLIPAQQISWFRSALASSLSFLFFLASLGVLTLLSQLGLDYGFLMRLLFG